MEQNHLNYIVIYDKIDESKLNHYETIFKVCTNREENNNFSLFFINNDNKIHDILCNNEILLEGLVSGKIDIYVGNNIIDFLKNSFCIFYFLDYKDDFFTKNIKEIISFNKFILHKPMDKYKALINVLKDLTNNKNHKFNQNNFLNNYDKLNGNKEINIIFEEFKNNYLNKNNEDNKNDRNNNDIKKIKLIKKVNLKEEDKKVIKESVEKSVPKNIEKNIQKNIQKNINIKLNKKNDLNMNHIYCTYYSHTNHNITNEIQIKCIIENCKNNLFQKYILFHDNHKELLIHYLKNELNEELINSIIFVQNDSKINKIISYLNTHYIGDIVYLSRSDILIPLQDDIKKLTFKILEHNYIYAISRIEQRLNGSIFKEQSFNNLLYSHLQDLYIFRPHININSNHIEIYNKLDFYETNFEILFNKMLESSGYYIVNDTLNCKILRIMCSDNINERHIMKKCSIDYKESDCSYIAENIILSKFSLENYINNLDLTEDEIYLVKQYIFKLFLKKNNLIKY